MKIFIIIAIVLIVALVAAQLVLSSQFTAKIGNLGSRLVASQSTSPAADMSLIPPIAREFAIRNGGRVGGPLAVTMIQNAEMRLSIDQAFFQLDASQVSGTRQPGFVWQAKGTMNALVPLQIVDAYVESVGVLEVRIAGSIPVATSTGSETAKGEAMRFLAELPWNPDAILNSAALRWTQIDESSVEVSIQTAGGLASVALHFNQDGDVTAIEADDRPRAGETAARWVGRFSKYARIGSYRFPSYGEIAWDLPAGEFIYWRGRILSVTPSET